jgi:hypothetical protein
LVEQLKQELEKMPEKFHIEVGDKELEITNILE